MGNRASTPEQGQQPPLRSWADVATISQRQMNELSGSSAPLGFPRRGPGAGGDALAPQPELRKADNVRVAANVRKDSVQLARAPDGRLCVEFEFDAECAGMVEVHLVAERLSAGAWSSRVASEACERAAFSPGKAQRHRSAAMLDLSALPADKLLYHKGSKTVPLVVVLRRDEGRHEDPPQQRLADLQCVLLTLTRKEELAGASASAGWGVAEFQRAIALGSTLFVVKELYGTSAGDGAEEDDGASGAKECVVCLSEARNTTILPCMHMCLCIDCAKRLRTSDAKCPLCRSHIKEFWQL
jgi:hypothetical protein